MNTQKNTTLREGLVSLSLWSAGLSWLIPNLGAMTVIQQFVSPQKLEAWNRFYCKVQLLLTGCTIEYVVAPEINEDQPYIFTQNHTNHFDHVTMYNATPHFKQGVELEKHFSYPFYGWFMKSRGTIPIPLDNGNARYEGLLRNAKEEVAKGSSILIFPEGTRTLDGNIGTLRPGAFRLARDLGIPVVPTTVCGMYDFMRKGSYTLSPGHRIVVYCDAPISMEGKSNEEMQNEMQSIQQQMQMHIDRYRISKKGKD